MGGRWAHVANAMQASDPLVLENACSMHGSDAELINAIQGRALL